MLQAIRDQAQGWIAWVIVGLIILTFALFGIDQYANGEKTIVVGSVNGEDISANEFVALYNRQKNRLDEQFGDLYDQVVKDDQLRDEVMNSLVESTAMRQWATDNNMIISDQQLAVTIHGASVFHKDGQFDDATYKEILLRNGFSVAQFEYEQRKTLLETQVRQLSMSSSFVTQHQLTRLIALQSQERKMDYLQVHKAPFVEKVIPTELDISTYFKANQASFMSPEKVKIDYIQISKSKIAEGVKTSPAILKSYFQDNQASFVVPEKRQASHILIRSGDAASLEESAKALEKVATIQADIEAGKSFSELAKMYSEDPGSAKMGGDLGLFQQGVMVPEFDEAVFSMVVGGVSDPIKTDFGYHIIKLTKVITKEAQSFDAVKEEVEEQYRAQMAEKAYFELLETAGRIAYEQPDSLASAADAVGLDVITSEFITREGGSSRILSSGKVLASVFSDDVLNNRLNSEAIEVSDSVSVIVRINKHEKATQKVLADVSVAITAMLKDTQGAENAKAYALELLAKANQGQSLKSLEEKGIQWHISGWVSRENRGVPAEITNALFQMKKPAVDSSNYVVASMVSGDAVVVEFMDVKQSKAQPNAKQVAELKSTIDGILSVSEVSSVLKSLVAVADVEKRSNYLTVK